MRKGSFTSRAFKKIEAGVVSAFSRAVYQKEFYLEVGIVDAIQRCGRVAIAVFRVPAIGEC